MAADPADIEYVGFEPTGVLYQFYLDLHDTSSSSKRPRGEEVHIPSHAGLLSLPTSVEEPKIDDTHTFYRIVALDGLKQVIYFGRLDVLSTRVQDSEARRRDYDAFKRGETPFALWKKEGKFLALGKYPDTVVVPPGATELFERWDKVQAERWRTLALKVSRDPVSSVQQWGETKARFKELPKDQKFRIVFTPNVPVLHKIDRPTLKDIVDATLGAGNYDVLEYAKAEAEGLKIVGSHPFLLYHMWMPSDDFKRLCGYNVAGKKLPRDDDGSLLKPFPNEDSATTSLFQKVNEQLGLNGKKDAADKSPPVRVSFQKLVSTHYAERLEYGGQSAAYNRVEANTVCLLSCCHRT